MSTEPSGFTEPYSHWGAYAVSPERQHLRISTGITSYGGTRLVFDTAPNSTRSRKAQIILKPDFLLKQAVTEIGSGKAVRTILDHMDKGDRAILLLELLGEQNGQT